MITKTCQRWREHRDTYRPIGEPIATQHYEVARISSDATARAFVERHHYSGNFPAARARTGLYRRGELVGVAVLSQPISQAALDAALPFSANRVELGRLVLLDDVPANGESWFIARTFELARLDGFDAVVSYSDPTPRTTHAGHTVFGGHIGTIYQATNGRYTGRSNASTLRLLPDGTVFSNRAWGKLRLQERGWQYARDLLVRHGAPAPQGDWRAWVTLAVESTTRRLRHPGNHRYVWALDKRLRRHLPTAQAYPKVSVRERK